MSEKRFKMVEDSNGLYSIFDTEDKENEPLIYGAEFGTEKIVALLNEQQATIQSLQEICTRTEEEKEHYADLYNECRRLKLSDEAIKQAYADINRREREKHSQGNATYTAKINQNRVIY